MALGTSHVAVLDGYLFSDYSPVIRSGFGDCPLEGTIPG